MNVCTLASVAFLAIDVRCSHRKRKPLLAVCTSIIATTPLHNFADPHEKRQTETLQRNSIRIPQQPSFDPPSPIRPEPIDTGVRARFGPGPRFPGARFGPGCQLPGVHFGPGSRLPGVHFGPGSRFPGARFGSGSRLPGVHFDPDPGFLRLIREPGRTGLGRLLLSPSTVARIDQ